MEISLVVEDEAPLFVTTDDNYAQNKIEQEEDSRNNLENLKPTLTRVIRKYLQDRGIDDVIEILNGIASTLMFITFFIFTYFDKFDPKREMQGDAEFPNWLVISETGLIVYLSADWLIALLLADARIPFLFSLESLVTYLTVLPLAMVNFEIVTDTSIQKVAGLYVWRICSIF